MHTIYARFSGADFERQPCEVLENVSSTHTRVRFWFMGKPTTLIVLTQYITDQYCEVCSNRA